jgi:hypothetical protein
MLAHPQISPSSVRVGSEYIFYLKFPNLIDYHVTKAISRLCTRKHLKFNYS